MFTCLFAIHVFAKMSLQVFVIFLNWLCMFFLANCESSFYFPIYKSFINVFLIKAYNV